jgi:hypothetical protein
VPPKCLLTFSWLHTIIYHKTVLFITTTMRTSNPTWNMLHTTILYLQPVSTYSLLEPWLWSFMNVQCYSWNILHVKNYQWRWGETLRLYVTNLIY